MPAVYNAKDVHHAVEMAEGFRSQGRYDWFRGQVQPWSPHSTLFRVFESKDKERIERAQKRIASFVLWARHTQGLEAIAEDRDALIAVAQHYGIPTHYI